MGPDINYPDQPSYGEGMAEAMKAQRQMIAGEGEFEGLGLLDPRMLELEKQMREEYGQLEVDQYADTLLGKITRAGEGGKYVSGQNFVNQEGQEVTGAKQIKSEEDRYDLYLQGRPDLQQAFESGGAGQGDSEKQAIAQIKAAGGTAQDFAKWHLYQAGRGHYGTDEQTRANTLPKVGDTYDPSAVDSNDYGQSVLTSEDVYSIHEGGEGAIVDRSGGMLDLYGGNTKIRQVDPQTGEVSYGTAGFDPESGEFQGLIPMQQQAEAYLASQQRESDISDVERYGTRATDAIRKQGEIGSVLGDIEDLTSENRGYLTGGQRKLFDRAQGLLQEGLSDREINAAKQLLRQSEAARGTGAIRDRGASEREVLGVMGEDMQRRALNEQRAMQLFGQGTGMGAEAQRQSVTHLGAEQATSADPMMAILGRPSANAPSAGALMGGSQQAAGQSAPQYFNPEAGLGYIQNMATNQANMYSAEVGAQGAATAGLMSGLGSAAGGAMMLCWVAREVYGETNPRWIKFRSWMIHKSPSWFFKLYLKHGERFAGWLRDKPVLKSVIRFWMNTKVA